MKRWAVKKFTNPIFFLCQFYWDESGTDQIKYRDGSSVIKIQYKLLEEFQYNQYIMPIKITVLLVVSCLLALGLTKNQNQGYPRQPLKLSLQSSHGNANSEYNLDLISRDLEKGNISFDQQQLNYLISNVNMSCKEKTAFLSGLIDLYKKKIAQNENSIYELLFNTSQTNSDKHYNENNELKKAQNQRQTIAANIKQQQNILDSYINQLQKLAKTKPSLQKTNEQLAIEKLESEVTKLDIMINQTIDKRAQLQKNMTIVKLKHLEQENLSEETLEEGYRRYSDLSFNASQKVKNKEAQINKLNAQLQSLTQTSFPIDSQIDQAKKRLQELKNSNTNNLSDINEVLKSNSLNIGNKVDFLNRDCSVR